MTNKNTKASDSTINDKQFKLYDFIPEFSKFRSSDEDFRHIFGTIDDNLYQSYRTGNLYFKSRRVRCNKCNGTKGHCLKLSWKIIVKFSYSLPIIAYNKYNN